jgi:hypothetical protein
MKFKHTQTTVKETEFTPEQFRQYLLHVQATKLIRQSETLKYRDMCFEILSGLLEKHRNHFFGSTGYSIIRNGQGRFNGVEYGWPGEDKKRYTADYIIQEIIDLESNKKRSKLHPG